MTGFQSQAGQVGFRTQSAKGSYADPGSSGVFVKLRSGGLGGNRELLIPDPEIGGGRDVADAYLGPASFGGDLEFYARMNGVLTLLNGALGSTVSTPQSGYTQHVVTPVDTELPWLSVEERIGKTFDTFRYTDAKVNNFKLEAEANGYLQGSVNVLALSQTAVGASATAAPAWDNTPMVVGSNITVNWDGTPLPAKSFSIEINNNLEDDDFRLGSLTLGDAVEKRREIQMGVTIRPIDSVLWRLAMYGDSNATQVGGTIQKNDVVITCLTYEMIGTSAQAYTLSFNIPVCAIAPYAVNPSGDDILENDLEIHALRPDPQNPILTATINTSATAVA